MDEELVLTDNRIEELGIFDDSLINRIEEFRTIKNRLMVSKPSKTSHFVQRDSACPGLKIGAWRELVELFPKRHPDFLIDFVRIGPGLDANIKRYA